MARNFAIGRNNDLSPTHKGSILCRQSSREDFLSIRYPYHQLFNTAAFEPGPPPAPSRATKTFTLPYFHFQAHVFRDTGVTHSDTLLCLFSARSSLSVADIGKKKKERWTRGGSDLLSRCLRPSPQSKTRMQSPTSSTSLTAHPCHASWISTPNSFPGPSSTPLSLQMPCFKSSPPSKNSWARGGWGAIRTSSEYLLW